jgi:hypothetical protein
VSPGSGPGYIYMGCHRLMVWDIYLGCHLQWSGVYIWGVTSSGLEYISGVSPGSGPGYISGVSPGSGPEYMSGVSPGSGPGYMSGLSPPVVRGISQNM